MMQTMDFQESQPLSPVMRLILLVLGASTVIGGILSLSGLPLGFFFLVPLAMALLLLRVLIWQERARAKKKAPGRSARPGA